MLGAINGDIVGSRFEFNNIKTKDFDLFTEESRFTDDTVLTIAVADWVCHANTKGLKEASKFLRKWARKYPYAGYGGMFSRWIYSNEGPYNSFGNGAAMRISPVGFMFNNEGDLKHASKIITGTTHNHPEGLKGAEVTAMCIYMAKNGASKDEIKEYVSKFYDLNFDYEELKRTYKHEEEICQCTVPQAIYCFLISKDFEDCLRTTISIGGDCDTTSAISCAIAEAFYGIPKEIEEKAKTYLTKEMIEIIDDFDFIENMSNWKENYREDN